jgi:predicted phosphodiesterase
MNAIRNASGATPIIAAISVGDHTETGTTAEWDYHMGIATPFFDPAATTFGGTVPRYLAVPGNHDSASYTSAWYDHWTTHFSGQASFSGSSSSSTGVYYSFSYENALFIGRDTNTATSSATAHRDDDQIAGLSTLLGTPSQFKFMFYHQPFYYCTSGGVPSSPQALPFLDLAAQNNVDVVFNGHSHVYTRTCRMTADHACTGTSTGTVQVELGTVGASDSRLRALNTAAQTRTAYDASGTSQTHGYTCVVDTTIANPSLRPYQVTLGNQRTFTYVKVESNLATITTYNVDTGAIVDRWTISH